MLIKVTIGNNDYTNYIEKYFKQFIINYYYYIDREYKENAQRWVPIKISMEDMLQKAMYKQKDITKEDYKTFKDYIRQGLAAYIYDKSGTTYGEELIYANLQIDFVDAIYDKDIITGNDEVVVYVLQIGKYINY